MDVKISVPDLRDVVKALRQVDREAPKLVSRLHKRIAGIYVRQAKINAAQRPRKEKMGHVAPTIRALGSQRSARIKAGGARAPDIFVQEFGGKVPLFGNQSRQVEVRPRKRDGHFLYPAVRQTAPTVARIYDDALEQAIRRYFER